MRGLTRRQASPLRLAIVLAALLGLLAMHGLSDHGSHQATTPADVHAAHATPDTSVGAAGQLSSEADVGVASGIRSSGGIGDRLVMGLCLAVLLLVAAVAMRHIRRGWPVAAFVMARWRSVALVVGSPPRRLHPPPYSLQVMRC